MRYIDANIFNEIDRICEQLASIEDPCLYCQYYNDCMCSDETCKDGILYSNAIADIENSIYGNDAVAKAYADLKAIGFIDKKVQEKKSLLQIAILRKDLTDLGNECKEILNNNGIILMDI